MQNNEKYFYWIQFKLIVTHFNREIKVKHRNSCKCKELSQLHLCYCSASSFSIADFPASMNLFLRPQLCQVSRALILSSNLLKSVSLKFRTQIANLEIAAAVNTTSCWKSRVLVWEHSKLPAVAEGAAGVIVQSTVDGFNWTHISNAEEWFFTANLSMFLWLWFWQRINRYRTTLISN